MHKSPPRGTEKLRYDYTYIHPYYNTATHTTCTVLYIPYPTTTAHTRNRAIQAKFFYSDRRGKSGIRESRDGMGGRPLSISVISISSLLLLHFYYLHILLLLSPSILPPSCTAKPCTVLYTVPVLFCFYIVEYIYHIRSYIMVTSIRG
jgi:hypothetical protein